MAESDVIKKETFDNPDEELDRILNDYSIWQLITRKSLFNPTRIEPKSVESVLYELKLLLSEVKSLFDDHLEPVFEYDAEVEVEVEIEPKLGLMLELESFKFKIGHHHGDVMIPRVQLDLKDDDLDVDDDEFDLKENDYDEGDLKDDVDFILQDQGNYSATRLSGPRLSCHPS